MLRGGRKLGYGRADDRFNSMHFFRHRCGEHKRGFWKMVQGQELKDALGVTDHELLKRVAQVKLRHNHGRDGRPSVSHMVPGSTATTTE